MKKTKSMYLLIFSLFLVVMFSLASCGEDSDVDSNSGSMEQGTTSTDADREVAENDLNQGESNISFTLSSPKEDDEIGSGSLTVSGKIESGKAKEVKVKMLLDDETVIGESTALVADVSHEFTTDVKYIIPSEKKSDNAIDCRVKLTIIDTNGDSSKEETIHVKVK